MTWYGIVALVLIIGGVAALMKALYGQKDSPTPCIGCGKCIATGECVMRREEMNRRRQLAQRKTSCEKGDSEGKPRVFSENAR